jgi:hypothetical protein
MGDGNLIRRKMRFERNFVQLPNQWVRDSRLSYKARGLLAELTSHESGWKVTIKALATNRHGEGLAGIRDAVQELEQYGYLKRYQVKIGGRFTADDWELTDPTDTGLEPLPTASSQSTRSSSTASSQSTRTASSQSTPLRTQVEDIKQVPKPATVARAIPAPTCEKGHDLIIEGRYCLYGCAVPEFFQMQQEH